MSENMANPLGKPEPKVTVISASARLFLKLIFGVTLLLLLSAGHATAAETTYFSLSECVKMGVSRNLQILSDQLAPKERKLDIEAARKIFIPQAKARILGSKADRREMEYSYSLEQKTTNGTTVGLGMSGQAFSLGNDYNNRLFSFSLNRPLLQNFGKQTTGIDIDMKTIEYETSLELFKYELNQFIQDLSVLYLELFFARENLRIQEQALERALKQYEDTRKDIESGVIPEQEIFLVEENVVNFEIKKENALRDISFYELGVKRLLNIEHPEDLTLVASDSFIACLSDPLELEASRELLFKNNPSYKIKTFALQKSRLDMDFYRNQLLPVLDFQARYDVSRGDANFDNNAYSVGFAYEMPISRKSDRAMVERSKIEVRRNELTLGDVEFNLSYDLQKLLLDIFHQRKILAAKERASELARKKLDNETDKYKNGISTLADIVRFQRELEDSTIEEFRTLVLLNKFRIQKLMLEGTLYQFFGIEID